jgi:hypothetical protein
MSYKGAVASAPRELVSFRMPTELNLIPIRLDLEFDGRKLKDAFTWNADGANLISSIFLLHHLPFSLSC